MLILRPVMNTYLRKGIFALSRESQLKTMLMMRSLENDGKKWAFPWHWVTVRWRWLLFIRMKENMLHAKRETRSKKPENKTKFFLYIFLALLIHIIGVGSCLEMLSVAQGGFMSLFDLGLSEFRLGCGCFESLGKKVTVISNGAKGGGKFRNYSRGNSGQKIFDEQLEMKIY